LRAGIGSGRGSQGPVVASSRPSLRRMARYEPGEGVFFGPLDQNRSTVSGSSTASTSRGMACSTHHTEMRVSTLTKRSIAAKPTGFDERNAGRTNGRSVLFQSVGSTSRGVYASMRHSTSAERTSTSNPLTAMTSRSGDQFVVRCLLISFVRALIALHRMRRGRAPTALRRSGLLVGSPSLPLVHEPCGAPHLIATSPSSPTIGAICISMPRCATSSLPWSSPWAGCL
jgi:hypothetical protein